MASPARLTVTYGLDADAYLVARAVDSALEGFGYHVSVDDDEIRIARRSQPGTEAVMFEPGQQLIVTYDEGWRIEDVPAVAPVADKRTPETWCAQYGVDIIDPDGWRSKSAPAWDEPITLADFYDRAVQCTIRNVASVDWTRIARDAKAVAA